MQSKELLEACPHMAAMFDGQLAVHATRMFGTLGGPGSRRDYTPLMARTLVAFRLASGALQRFTHCADGGGFGLSREPWVLGQLEHQLATGMPHVVHIYISGTAKLSVGVPFELHDELVALT